MSKLVTIYGGSGFVGRYVARRMAKEGWRVRVAVRNPNEAIFVKPYGVVGQVEPVLCNIRDDASVASVMQGADAVVNCVGILAESGKNKFDAVQHEGAERIARLAAKAGIERMVLVSAIGADEKSDSQYAVSKALGEQGVLAHMPNAMIVRPSIVFGPEDEFFNRFAAMSRMGPILPVVGAATKFQPVYVDDVAQAVVLGVLGKASGGVYELGGPEVHTFKDLMGEMLSVIRRRKLVVNIPFPVANVMAFRFFCRRRCCPWVLLLRQLLRIRYVTCVGITLYQMMQRRLRIWVLRPQLWSQFCRNTCGVSVRPGSMTRSRKAQRTSRLRCTQSPEVLRQVRFCR
jgi:NADH dehydrogenase